MRTLMIGIATCCLVMSYGQSAQAQNRYDDPRSISQPTPSFETNNGGSTFPRKTSSNFFSRTGKETGPSNTRPTKSATETPTRQPQRFTRRSTTKPSATQKAPANKIQVKNYYSELFPSPPSQPKLNTKPQQIGTQPRRLPRGSIQNPIQQRTKTLRDPNLAPASFQDGPQLQTLPGPKTNLRAAPKQPTGVIQAEYQENPNQPKNKIQQIGVERTETTPPPLPAQPVLPQVEPVLTPQSQVGPMTTKAPTKVYQASHFSFDQAASANPSIELKWKKRTEFIVGQECEFDLIVSNTGSGDAMDVVIDAYFPAAVRLTKAAPKPLASNDRLSWTFDKIAESEQHVIRLAMVPSQRGDLNTRATARFTSVASNQFTVQEPMLKLAVTGPDEVIIGEPASQVVQVSNPGTGIAKKVEIEVRVPQGLEHPRGERLLMEIGSLNPGEKRNVRLSLSARAGGKHDVQIMARAENGLRQLSTAKVNVIAPSLTLDVAGPSLRYIGRSATYAVTVTNTGSAATNNVRVVHEIPAGFEYHKADKGGKWEEASRTINWFVGRLDAGESMKLQLHLTAKQLGDHAHKVRATSEHGAKTDAGIKTRIDGTASLILEIVDLDDPVEIGKETAYEIRVKNEGSKADTNVGIACELPRGAQLVSVKGASQYREADGGVFFKPLPNLAPGKVAVFQVILKGNVAGNHRFKARLTSDSITDPLIFQELTKFYED